jgi:hypothetical protein
MDVKCVLSPEGKNGLIVFVSEKLLRRVFVPEGDEVTGDEEFIIYSHH